VIYEATVGERVLRVEVRRENAGLEVRLDGKKIDVDFLEVGPRFASLILDGRSHEIGLEQKDFGYRVLLRDELLEVQLQEAARGVASSLKKAAHGAAKVTAPMPGKIVRLLAQKEQAVAAGQGLVVMEAMKMENELKAPRAGRVREIKVGEGQAVETGALLVVLD